MTATVFDLIPKWALAALVATFAATSCKLKWDKDGLSVEIEKVRVVLEQERVAYAESRAAALEAHANTIARHREVEQSLQAAATQARRERDVQVAAARRASDDLRERLFSAIEIPAGPNFPTSYSLASVAGPRPFAHGTVGALLRDEAPDAARLLVDEAERADIIRAELMRCYRQYDEAAHSLKNTTERPTDWQNTQER